MVRRSTTSKRRLRSSEESKHIPLLYLHLAQPREHSYILSRLKKRPPLPSSNQPRLTLQLRLMSQRRQPRLIQQLPPQQRLVVRSRAPLQRQRLQPKQQLKNQLLLPKVPRQKSQQLLVNLLTPTRQLSWALPLRTQPQVTTHPPPRLMNPRPAQQMPR